VPWTYGITAGYLKRSAKYFRFPNAAATGGERSLKNSALSVGPPSPLVGRTQLLTRAVLTALEYLYAEESDLFLDEACTWLGVVHGITIMPSTLS